jgi:hypothetical protein
MSPPATVVPTLVVFCRRPAPGVGKRRIAAAAGDAFARELGEHLLAAAVEDAAAWPGPVVLSPADPADAGWAARLLGGGARVVAQGAGNLGERLGRVDAELRREGATRLVYIGSDAPLLDFAAYARARRALDHADVVLGPAEDGGVTLMGARRPWPELADLPWSTAALGDALGRRCRAAGLTVEWLALSYDVDEAEILPRLAADLARDPRDARRALREWLCASLPAVAGARR